VDRGCDPDAADPFGGLTAHAYDSDAPVCLLGDRPGTQPSEQGTAVPTRPWSWHAISALLAAWAAIAASYRTAGPMGEADGSIHSAGGEP
jgi:hypothetical protein